MSARLEDLPVELLYEIQLHALSAALPHAAARIYRVFKAAPPSYNAQYLLRRIVAAHPAPTLSAVVTHALRYPLCTEPVIAPLARAAAALPAARAPPELPRRLFRRLAPRPPPAAWSPADPPLPLLRALYAARGIPAPDANAHDGYALTRAVHAGATPLVRFLLARGASPARKGALAVLVAIRRRDLALVRLLVEREDGAEADGAAGRGKRRRLQDRVQATPEMLRAAVRCDARDIVEYLTAEKGCVPDMQTLRMMAR